MSKINNTPRSRNSSFITKILAPENSSSNMASKETNGLKAYKRAQKEKKFAKRAIVVAEQKRAKKMSASAKAIILSDAECTKAISTLEGTLGIVAPRKALELALYKKMETPRQMLIRCDFKAYMDTEFHGKVAEFDCMAPHDVYLDDNGFKTTISSSGSKTQAKLFAHEVELSPLEQVQTEKKVALSHPAPQAHRCDSCFFKHIMTAASAQEAVTAKVQEATNFSTSSQPPEATSTQVPHLIDPAIVSHKIKQQTPARLEIIVTNNAQTTSKHVEGTGLNDSPSSLTSTLVSTPDSSPTNTHCSSVSLLVGSNARAYTPPTPQLTFAFLGHWDHCSYPKPGDIADWSLLELSPRM